MNTTGTRRQETYAQRYGTAAEPQPPPDIQPNAKDSSSNQNDKSLAGAIEKEVKTPAKVEEKNAEPAATKDKPDSEDKENPDQSRDDAIETATSDPTKRGPELDASELHPREGPDPSAQHAQNARTAKPLESFLKTGTASAETQEEHKTPHLQAPPYVHHFDTFTLVKDLERGGFTHDQSVTLMKAVRILLAINLDVAKEGLVSKSDVENVCPLTHQHPFSLSSHTSLLPKTLKSLLNQYLTKTRKPTSSAPPVPNSAPKSSTPANPPPPNKPPHSPTSSTASTSSRSAPPKKPSPCKTT